MARITTRIIIAFTFLFVCILGLSSFLLFQQRTGMSHFHHTVDELIPLEKQSIDIEKQVLTVNRLSNEHAEELDTNARAAIVEQITALILEITNNLSDYIVSAEKFISSENQTELSEIFKIQSQLLPKILQKNQAVSSSLQHRTDSLEKMESSLFSGKLKFDKTMNRIEAANSGDITFTINDKNSLTSHVSQARNYLLRIPTINDPWEAEDAKSELDTHLDKIEEYAKKIIERHKDSKTAIVQYSNAILIAANEEKGIYHSHVLWLESNSERQELKKEYKNNLNSFLKKLNETTSIVSTAISNAKAEAQSVGDESLLTGIVVLAVALFLTLAIGSHIYLSIHRPLSTTINALHALEEGDLTYELQSIDNTEFSKISSHVNQLSTQLRSIISSIKENSDELETLAEETDITHNEALDQSKHQFEMMEDIGQSAIFLEESTNNVDNALQNIHSQVDTLIQLSETNKSIMEANVNSIHALENDLNITTETVVKLSNSVKSISSILEVIQTIAEQTNLLALNAAIEAARAGEQGRGFAVVADEVRNLAIKTHQSIAETYKTIEQLHGNAEEAVELVRNTMVSANACVEEAEKSKAQSDSIEKVSGALMELNEVVGEQAAKQRSVMSSVFNKITEVSNSAQTTENTIQKSAKSQHKLLALAHEGRKLLNQFRLR